jgi:hypothetical protein
MNPPGIRNPVLDTAGSGPGEPILGNLISAVLGFIVVIGFIVAFLYLILGAMNWISSAGDKSKLETARIQITQALVGLIILVAVWGIMRVVGSFLGIGFPTLVFPKL